MKNLLPIILVLLLVPAAFAQPAFLTTAENFHLPLYAFDSAGVDLVPPESLFVVVYDQDGDSVYSLIGDTTNAACKGPYLRRYGNASSANEYTYFATVGTLDGTTGGTGLYRVEIMIWNSNEDVTWRVAGSFYEVSTSFETTLGRLDAAITTRSSFAAATDSVIVDGSSLASTSGAIATGTFAAGAITNAVLGDGAISLSKMDSAAMYSSYAGGIWIDEAGGNTNTVTGTDGTPSNPVSTFTAARTIADDLGVQKYYLMNNSSLTLAATHEHWEFIGLGLGNLINLGDQDVDSSMFINLELFGSQGGTNAMIAKDCFLSGTDSLTIFADNCWISGNLTLSGTDSYFDNCQSAVAGGATPTVKFDGSGTTDLSFRNYSGGVEFLTMVAGDVLSYEADGQVIFNVNCTGGTASLRGNMSVTNNGSTSLTTDAVYNYTLGTNTTALSGDATAADNQEYFFDGTGATQDIALSTRTLEIGGGLSTSPNPAFEVSSSDDNAFELTSSTNAGFVATANTFGMILDGGLQLIPGTGAALDIGGTVDVTAATGTTPLITVENTSGDTSMVFRDRSVYEGNVVYSNDIAGRIGLHDSLNNSIIYNALYNGLGGGGGNAGVVGLDPIGEFNKDTAFVLNNAQTDTLLKIIYIRNGGDGTPVDTIRFIRP